MIDLANSLQPPGLAHPFGTDQSGRDLFTRVIYGSRESLLIGLGATVLATAVALILGIAAGLGGRLSDGLISRGR